MTQYIYLSCVVVLGGVLLLNSQLRTGVIGPRLLRSALITVTLFLCFDAIGAARGWFASSPRTPVR